MYPEFISSESNSRIKLVKALRDRKKVRHAERLFIVEGPRFVDDAMIFATPKLIVLSETRANETGEIDTGIDTIVVPDPLFAAISDTATPQGVLAIFPIPESIAEADGSELVVVADGIQDPGNLGTLIRSSVALGATRVVCARGTVDPWSPKVARAAASALFQIPIRINVELLDELDGLAVFVATGFGEMSVADPDWTQPSAVIVGNEGHGVTADLSLISHTSIAIPMARPVESLNAGVAASIVLYEASSQRATRAR